MGHEYRKEEDKVFFSAWGIPKSTTQFKPYSIDHHFIPFKAVIPANEEPYVKARERCLKRGDYVEADNIDQQHRDFLKQQYAQRPKWSPRAVPGSQAEDSQGEA